METSSASTASTPFERLCSVDDVVRRHLLPFLTHRDSSRVGSVSRTLRAQFQSDPCWKVLCNRDYGYGDVFVSGGEGEGGDGAAAASNSSALTDEERLDAAAVPMAPVCRALPGEGRQRVFFDALETFDSWKTAYEKWSFWNNWTAGGSKASHMVLVVMLWQRLKAVLQRHGLSNIVESLSPCIDREYFQELVKNYRVPSSLVAFYSVHGGQEMLTPRSPDGEFFAGLFGSYTCYNNFYSMRLMRVEGFYDENDRNNRFGAIIDRGDGLIVVAVSPGNPRVYLALLPSAEDPEGSVIMGGRGGPVVCRGGILPYLQSYVENLENGVFKPVQLIPEVPASLGIGLFPDAGDSVSRCVTAGIEVRASARWFPGGAMDQMHGLNFGYSIRIRMVEEGENNDGADADGGESAATTPSTCQLVGRHWEFMDGNGAVRRVNGDGVIGKQPLFYREDDGTTGFVDLGVAGDGNQYPHKVFVYESQSGPVAGTSFEDTGRAQVQGSFSFIPGSIENPAGPMFHVTVATFPLKIPHPFY